MKNTKGSQKEFSKFVGNAIHDYTVKPTESYKNIPKIINTQKELESKPNTTYTNPKYNSFRNIDMDVLMETCKIYGSYLAQLYSYLYDFNIREKDIQHPLLRNYDSCPLNFLSLNNDNSPNVVNIWTINGNELE